MKILLTFFVLFFSSSVFSYLRAEENKYIVWGPTASDCPFFLKGFDFDTNVEGFSAIDLMEVIIQSYLSGYNHYIKEKSGYYKHLNYNNLDYALYFVKNYCEKNPEKDVDDAIITYLMTLPDLK